MKHYPAEFNADAVALYRSRPGATFKSVATDLGVYTETLRNWVRAADGRRSGPHTTPPAAGGNTGRGGAGRGSAQDPRAGGGTRRPPQGGPVFRYFARETRW
ncbi:transposase [Streptomyces sp. NPDC006510]|uniref:transposase n=1 Tax=Streptomyces sp. NPDC006510 TaxID=3155600 RepID=UPI0033AD089C